MRRDEKRREGEETRKKKRTGEEKWMSCDIKTSHNLLANHCNTTTLTCCYCAYVPLFVLQFIDRDRAARGHSVPRY